METTAKTQFLQKTLRATSDPAKVFDILLREYRISGSEAKQELVMALVTELAAYNATKTFI